MQEGPTVVVKNGCFQSCLGVIAGLIVVFLILSWL